MALQIQFEPILTSDERTTLYSSLCNSTHTLFLCRCPHVQHRRRPAMQCMVCKHKLKTQLTELVCGRCAYVSDCDGYLARNVSHLLPTRSLCICSWNLDHDPPCVKRFKMVDSTIHWQQLTLISESELIDGSVFDPERFDWEQIDTLYPD